MVTYWTRNSNPNLESMMLDTNANKINRVEYPEILECLPDLTGKRVLELGAGIGYSHIRLDRVDQIDYVYLFVDVSQQRLLK
jgi:predicted O-methyltransferase YrrM